MSATKNRIAQDILMTIERFGSLPHAHINGDIASQNVIREMIDVGYIGVDFNSDTEVLYIKATQDEITKNIAENSNAILLSSTNLEMEMHYKNRNGIIYLSDKKVLFFLGRYNEVIFRTSLLVGYEKKEDTVTFKTLNSEYVFKLLSEIKIDENNFATQDEIDETKEASPLFYIMPTI